MTKQNEEKISQSWTAPETGFAVLDMTELQSFWNPLGSLLMVLKQNLLR